MRQGTGVEVATPPMRLATSQDVQRNALQTVAYPEALRLDGEDQDICSALSRDTIYLILLGLLLTHIRFSGPPYQTTYLRIPRHPDPTTLSKYSIPENLPWM